MQSRIQTRPTPVRWPIGTVRHGLVLHLALPLSIAALFTLLRSGMAALLPFPYALLLWTLLVLPAWWAVQLLCTVLHRVLRPWTPPLWAICLLASVLQALLLGPYYRFVYAWAVTLSGGVQLHGAWPLPEPTLAYAATLAWSIAPGALLWIAANYFYDRVLDVPRFRYERPSTASVPAPVHTPSPSPATAGASPLAIDAAPVAPAGTSGSQSRPPVLARSRLPAGAEIRAVTAEEHYVRLYTDVGTDLVRYRFSDALGELAAIAGGLQVHRSWWVRMDLVTDWHDRGRSCELELAGGLRVPVSLAFRAAALARLPAHVKERPGRLVRG